MSSFSSFFSFFMYVCMYVLYVCMYVCIVRTYCAYIRITTTNTTFSYFKKNVLGCDNRREATLSGFDTSRFSSFLSVCKTQKQPKGVQI